MQIIPAILPKNRDALVEKLRLLSDAGYSGRVQVDLCDGQFVPSVTWPFADFSGRDAFLEHIHEFVIDDVLQELLQKFEIDYDLMVMDAEHLFSVWDMLDPKNIIIHLDALTDNEALMIDVTVVPSPFDFVKNKNIILALSQTTDIGKLTYWHRNTDIRQVQIMGITTIGKQGGAFSDNTLEIIKAIQQQFPDISIQVDGGINQESIKKIAPTNIASVVAGSAIFADGDIMENMNDLKKCAIL
jgi:pentose-5-phosphate-3-epimerase